MQGVLVTNTVANGSYKTITTADGPQLPYRATWSRCGSPMTCITGAMASFTIADRERRRQPARVPHQPHSASPHSGTIASAATPGVVALAYEADFGQCQRYTKFQRHHERRSRELGKFNNFFDMWDDENATIDHFNNNAEPMNEGRPGRDPTSASGGAEPPRDIGTLAPVITIRDSNITANISELRHRLHYNNGLYIENTVVPSLGAVAGSLFGRTPPERQGRLP